MPEGDGTQAHPVLNELVAVDIPDMTTFPFDDKARGQNRILIIPFRIRVRTPGDQAMALFLQYP